jgi:hypothetical protein
MSKKQNVYGEGNYAASRRYYAGVKKFVDSGQVDAAAREAAPKTPAEAAEMREAEEAALLRSKGTKKPPSIKEPVAPPPSIDEPGRDREVPRKCNSPHPGRRPDRH